MGNGNGDYIGKEFDLQKHGFPKEDLDELVKSVVSSL